MKFADFINTPTYGSTRDGFGEGLVEAGIQDQNVIALCADLSESTKVHWFKNTFPDRYFEMGVAEENMIGVATGLALTGKIPFASSYSTFIVGNALGPIRSSVCYSNANVKIIGGHSGFSANADGATHQALEDIAVMKTLPNMTVIVPCDQIEAKKATLAISKNNGPDYLRVGKYNSLNLTTKETPFEIGKALTMQKGQDITIVACGSMVAESLKAADKLKNDYSIEVINMHTIKPLDHKAILESIIKTGAIISVEEHQESGGLGSSIAEFLSQPNLTGLKTQIPLKIMGVKNAFGESGSVEQLYKKHKLTSEDIENEINLLMTIKANAI